MSGGVTPDMVTFAKGVTGFPMGAPVAFGENLRLCSSRFHSSAARQSAACVIAAAGLATLDVEDENLVTNL